MSTLTSIAPPRAVPVDWYAGFFRSAEVFLGLLVGATVAVVLVQVWGRYGGVSVPWAQEAASVLFIWSAFVGAGLATDRWNHYALDLALGWFGSAGRARLEALGAVSTLLFGAILLVSGFAYALSVSSSTYVSLGISRSWVYAALPVGGLLMCAASLRRLLLALSGRLVAVGACEPGEGL